MLNASEARPNVAPLKQTPAPGLDHNPSPSRPLALSPSRPRYPGPSQSCMSILARMAERAKLFRNGGSQAVRLPKDCRFPDDQSEVVVRKVGDRSFSNLSLLGPGRSWPASALGKMRSLAKGPANWQPQGSLCMTKRLFMLDSDTISFVLRGEGEAGANLTARAPGRSLLERHLLSELRFGADKRHSKRPHRLIDTFTASIEVVAFDAAAALIFGRLCAGGGLFRSCWGGSFEAPGTLFFGVDGL
jgi:hypothetical protein